MPNQHFGNIYGGANACFRASNVKFEAVYITDPEFLKKVLGEIRDVLQWASTTSKASYHQVHDKVTKLVTFIPEIGPFRAQFMLPLCTLVGLCKPRAASDFAFPAPGLGSHKILQQAGCGDKTFLGVIKTLSKHLKFGDDDRPSQVESQLCESGRN
jgi:hypothetical protein